MNKNKTEKGDSKLRGRGEEEKPTKDTENEPSVEQKQTKKCVVGLELKYNGTKNWPLGFAVWRSLLTLASRDLVKWYKEKPKFQWLYKRMGSEE